MLQWLAKLAQLGGMVLLFGWSAFQFALVPAPAGPPPADGVPAMVLRRWRWAAAAGAVLLALGTAAQIVRMFGPLVSGLPLDMQLELGWAAVTGSSVGRLQLLQLGLTAAFWVLAALGRRAGWTAASPAAAGVWRWTLLLLTAAMAAAVVWGGHAVSSLSRWVSLGAQWSHLLVVSLWAGGLLLFASLPWRTLDGAGFSRVPFLRDALRRLSSLGFLAVLTVLVSGFLLGGLYILNLTAAAGSWYGRGIGLKIGLLGAVAAVAGINRLWVLPRVEGAGPAAAPIRWLGRLLRIEAALVSAIVAVSAVVTQLPPPSTPGVMAPQTWTLPAGPFELDVFASSPGGAAVQFEIRVRDAADQWVTVDELQLHLDMPGHFMGISPVVVPPASTGQYVVSPPISMAGPWQAGIVLQHDGEIHAATVNFQVSRAALADHSRLQRLLAGQPAGAVGLILAAAVAAAGLGLWLARTSPFSTGPGRGAWPLGALLLAAGGLWALQLTGLVPAGVETGGPAPGTAGTVPAAAGDPGAGLAPGFPRLELAADAGEYLFRVGLDPAAAGVNALRVHLQDYFGDPVPAVVVRAHVVHPADPEPRAVDLEPAGDGQTYAGRAELEEGPVELRLAAVRPDTGAAVAEAALWLPIPAGGAKDLLRLADESMNRLQSVRLREVMQGRPDGDLVTDMEFAAPDRARMKSSNGREIVIIGETRYQRSGDDQPWSQSPWPQVRGFRWPDFDYAELAARQTLMGQDELKGRPVWVVAFVQDPPDIRYVVWIDAETYWIHRLTMLTTGHYMYWTFYDFNAPVAIEPPVNPAP